MTRKILTALAANQAADTAATAAGFTFAWPIVGETNRGEAAVALRHLLTVRRFNPDGVDGIFGPDTRAAVTRLQAFKGL